MTTRAARRAADTQRIIAEERQKVVDHAAGGLRLTPGAVARIEQRGRSRIRKPESDRERLGVMAGLRAANTTIPADVQLALETLNTLADEGNFMAAILFESEAKRLGLWVERKLF